MLATLMLRDVVYLYALLLGVSFGFFIRSISRKRLLGALLSPAVPLVFSPLLFWSLAQCNHVSCIEFLPFAVALFLVSVILFLLPPQVFMSALVLSSLLCVVFLTITGPLSTGTPFICVQLEKKSQAGITLRSDYGVSAELSMAPEDELFVKLDMLLIDSSVPFIGDVLILRQISVGNSLSWRELFPSTIGSPAILNRIPIPPFVKAQEWALPLNTQQVRRGLTYEIAIDEDRASLKAVF